MKPRHKSIVKNPEPEKAPFALVQETATEEPPKRRPINEFERIKYERTLAFGGLVPERSGFLDSLCRKLGDNKKTWAKK